MESRRKLRKSNDTSVALRSLDVARLQRDLWECTVGDVRLTALLASAEYGSAAPWAHCVLRPFDIALLQEAVQQAVNCLHATVKETDIFRVQQSGDWKAFDALPVPQRRKVSGLVKLRDALYSDTFRTSISKITGCGALSDRVDCASNVYERGSHLLCHDDAISTRKISYILYLSDTPTGGWQAEHGGALELYRVHTLGDLRTASSVPEKRILPIFGTMVIFEVVPGVSLHSVQEVFGEARRISIQGWYHAAQSHDADPCATIASLTSRTPPLTVEQSAEFHEIISLGIVSMEFVNAPYFVADNLRQLQRQFQHVRAVQCAAFFSEAFATKLADALMACDSMNEVGYGRPAADHVGVHPQTAWCIVGPPQLRRFVQYVDDGNENSSRLKLERAGRLLCQAKAVLESPAFAFILKQVTGLQPVLYHSTIRRFRPGQDYTVAHYGTLVDEACTVLDVIWSFVVPHEVWSTGDVGGFLCYTKVDADPESARKHAEVYTGGDNGKAEVEDDGTEAQREAADDVVSLHALPNTLNIVLRQPSQLRFTRYVSAQAPSSRWDVVVQFKVEKEVE